MRPPAPRSGPAPLPALTDAPTVPGSWPDNGFADAAAIMPTLRSTPAESTATPIALDRPDRPLDRRLLDRAGGFAWWYLDLRNDRGDGVVMIWSFGLPFLPGYLSAARRGAPQRPGDRPSLNIAVYRQGREAFYLLQELPPDRVSWTDGDRRWTFGDTVLTSRLEGGRRVLDGVIDCPVPGSLRRLRGTVRIEGAATKPHPDAGADPERATVETTSSHLWTPLVASATGRVHLCHGDEVVAAFEGRAYHDRNGSSVPLDRLGLAHWVWGRIAAGDEDLIYYVNVPETGAAPTALFFSLGPDGVLAQRDDLDVRWGPGSRGLFGMPYWPTLSVCRSDGRPLATIRRQGPVDDGPFYLRFLTEVTLADGTPAVGVEELCRIDRIDRDHERRFVRMRVHDLGGDNSWLLPLFAGARKPVRERLASKVTAFGARVLGLVEPAFRSRPALDGTSPRGPERNPV